MAGRAVLLCVVLLLTACGGESGDGGGASAVGNEQSIEAAYREAYDAAWVKACRAAAASLRKRDVAGAGKVECAKPVEQMEGNTSFDAAQAREEGRRQGEFDGCAYAWDETYAETAVDVEPQCE
jgi:hypothetical protein